MASCKAFIFTRTVSTLYAFGEGLHFFPRVSVGHRKPQGRNALPFSSITEHILTNVKSILHMYPPAAPTSYTYYKK